MSTTPTVEELLIRLEALRIEESHVIQQIRQAQNRERNTRTAVAPNNIGEFCLGCRVEIINGVKSKRSRRTVTIEDRQGTVYKLTDTRVCFITDNGDNTWRAYKNIRVL